MRTRKAYALHRNHSIAVLIHFQRQRSLQILKQKEEASWSFNIYIYTKYKHHRAEPESIIDLFKSIWDGHLGKIKAQKQRIIECNFSLTPNQYFNTLRVWERALNSSEKTKQTAWSSKGSSNRLVAIKAHQSSLYRRRTEHSAFMSITEHWTQSKSNAYIL